MYGIVFLQDLAVVMIVSGLVTIVFHHFKQPVVLGYILAGLSEFQFAQRESLNNFASPADKEKASSL